MLSNTSFDEIDPICGVYSWQISETIRYVELWKFKNIIPLILYRGYIERLFVSKSKDREEENGFVPIFWTSKDDLKVTGGSSRFYSDSIDDSRGNFGGVKICIWV